MKPCVTHHYACDCREAKVRALIHAAQEMLLAEPGFEDLDALKDALDELAPPDSFGVDV